MSMGTEVSAETAVRAPTIRESLVSEKTRLNYQLQKVEKALQILDENPSFEKVHDAIASTGISVRLR